MFRQHLLTVSTDELMASIIELPPKIGTPMKEIHLAGAVEDTKISEVVRFAAATLRANHRLVTKHVLDAWESKVLVLRAVW